MRNTIFFAAILALPLAATPDAPAQVSRSGLLSRFSARQYGLERVWFARVELDRSRSRIAHLAQHVSSKRAHTEFEVKRPEGSIVYSERQLDSFGEPLGVERAKQMAEAKIAELQAALGADADADANNIELVTHVIPEITLYALSDQSVLHAIDGETGRTRWATQVGRRDHPSLAPSANDDYVALVNGSYVYVLDSLEGQIQWRRQTVGVPGAGPAVSELLVHVPIVGGSLEGYQLADSTKAPVITQSHGHSLVQPTVTSEVVAWPTDRGHLYVAASSDQEIRYRLEAKDLISSPAAYSPDRGLLLVTSNDGYIYCITERFGDLLWRFSTGQPITAAPVVIGEDVYVVTDEDTLFCISTDTGEERWITQGVVKFVARSAERVFCVAVQGDLLVLAAGSGARIGAVPTNLLDVQFVNSETDRIFLGASTGVIQCLRETSANWPLVHAGIAELKEAQAEAEAPMPGAAAPIDDMPMPPAKDDDPFGAGADPFDAPAAPAGDSNPFGTKSDNPFGAPADDPFNN